MIFITLLFLTYTISLSFHNLSKLVVMPIKQFEDVPFLDEEGDFPEKDDLRTDPTPLPRSRYFTRRTISAALTSLLLAGVLIITVIAVSTQSIPAKDSRNGYSIHGQEVLEDLSLDEMLAPNKLNPDLYDFPRRGSVVAKTPGCGNSPQEAKALGCIFDPMNWHWTRPECFYKEGSERSQAKGPWKYYRDTNFTELMVLPDKEAMSTERLMFTEHSWHVQHCVYALESMHRAALLGTWIPEEAASWPHTLHCMTVFQMMGTPPKTLNTRVDMQFLGCVKFEF